ncbi:MAG: PVC-type heme-binding CxxCH protein [Planctomyces sp.]
MRPAPSLMIVGVLSHLHVVTLLLCSFNVHPASTAICVAAEENAAASHQDLTWFQDQAGQIQPIRTEADWLARRQSILEGMQKAMGNLPAAQKESDFNIQVRSDEKIQGVRRLSLTIRTEPDSAKNSDQLPLDLYIPEPFATQLDPAKLLEIDFTSKAPAMLALHPTGKLGKRILAGEGDKTNRQYGLELARRGYITVCPDYPSFGDYTYDFSTDRYDSGTMKGIVNHRRCVDLLSALRCVDASRIGVIGHSLGGHNSMFAAVFDERLKIVVSSCGWTPFTDYYKGNIQGWTGDVYMPRLKTEYNLDPQKVPFDFQEVVAAIAPRTFVSISPLHDANFDVEGVRKAIPRAQQIYSLLNAKNELILATPDCEHDFPADMRQKAYREIDRVLKHQPASEPEPDYSGELPRIAPHEPTDAMKTFQIAPGFELQQAATEPNVVDPVAMAFDENGLLYVVEMRDYSEQAEEKLGRIRVLEDANNDGVFEDSRIFVDQLSWPTAVTCFDGGIFVGAAPHIFYLKDTDGDRKADINQLVFTGFGRNNVQGLVNCLHWGPDNRIYGQTSSSGGTIQTVPHPDRPVVELRQRDFSFNPRTLELRPESGGAQHGMCFDDWGNRYVCSNSDHAQAIVYNDRYLNRNPQVSAAPPRISIADDGGQAPVFRISPVEPWRIVRTRLRASGVVPGIVEGGGKPAGYFTGSTGINVYRGDAWPNEMKGLLIMADVGSNIVHRKKSVPNGVGWTASRIDPGTEFVASSDIWFRPVQFANAPDGCLYILDMYREVIEHPASLPPEIKQHLDLTSGRDRGRLYRICPSGWKSWRTASLGKLSTPRLVATLEHPNGWHRDTASRLIYERQDPAAAPLLNVLVSSGTSEAKTHSLNALNTLIVDGKSALTSETVLKGIRDSHPRVRETAARLAEQFGDSAEIADGLASLADDEDARVRLQVAFSLGSVSPEKRIAPLLRLIVRDGADRWIRTAVLTSLQTETFAALQTLSKDTASVSTPAVRSSLPELAELATRQSPPEELDKIAATIAGLSGDRVLQLELVNRVFRGRPETRSNAAFQQLSKSMIEESRITAEKADSDINERIAAVRALSLSDASSESERLFGLLNAITPPEVQLAAIDVLASFSDRSIAEQLIERYSELSPKLMERTRDVMLNRTEWAVDFLTAITTGRIPVNAVSGADLQRLAGHPDATLKEKAATLLKAMGTSSRDEVIKRYLPVLSMVGNPQRGAVVFKQQCSVCHQLGGMGHQVGPNLATVTARGAETLLVNLLDPNREVNPAWRDYIALTTAGTTHNGVIISESSTSITLRRAEAKEDSLLRSDLETVRDTGKSLMPEGLEKNIDPQAMADLISWLLEQK